MDIKLENEDLDLSIVKEESTVQEGSSSDSKDQDVQVEGSKQMNPCVKADPESEFTLMYACPYCDRVFTAMFYYERHIFLAHPRFNPFVCKLCKKKFKNETDRQNHVCLVSVGSLSNKVKSKIFPCDDCPRVFPTKALVKQHDLLKHSGKHVCINCKFIFNNAKMKYLEYLKKCNCGPEEKARKNIKCTICERTFCRMQSLKNHIKIHEERKSSESTMEKKSKLAYKCDRCPKVFPGTQALIDHIRAEHRGSFQCPKCTFRFYKQEELDTHLNEHKNLPFVCKACSRLFKFSDSLEKHIKTYHKHLYKSDDDSSNNDRSTKNNSLEYAAE